MKYTLLNLYFQETNCPTKLTKIVSQKILIFVKVASDLL
jgi:hypothetical protein